MFLPPTFCFHVNGLNVSFLVEFATVSSLPQFSAIFCWSLLCWVSCGCGRIVFASTSHGSIVSHICCVRVIAAMWRMFFSILSAVTE